MTEEQILEELKSSYESIYEIPSVSGGRLSADGSVTVVLSQRDIRNNTNRSYLQYYRKFNDKYEPSGFPVQMGANVHASSISPDGKFLALFVKTGKDDEPGFGHTKAVDYAIELWDRTRVVKQVIVKDTHGKVVNDEYFGRVTWASNSKLVYVAEMKTSAPKTVWDKEYDHNKESHFDIVNQEDYGEGLVGTKLTRAFVCNFESRSVTEVAGVPNKIAVSSPIWSPDGQGVIFVGFDVSRKRLGLKYCVQRESALYYSEADKDCEMLTEGVWNARRPVVDQSGKRIAFLSTGKVPFHMTCNKLMIIEWPSKKVSTVVDIVDKPESDDAFPGLYATEIILRAWNGDHIYLSSGWRSQTSVVKINVATSAVTRIASSVSGGSVSLLDQFDGKLLLVEQSPVNPYRVIIKDESNTNTVVTECETQFNQVSWEIRKIDVDGGEIEYILIQPPAEISNKSLMVTPHGGPHSSYTTIFISSLMYYCLHGYTICMVNYRGSPGFGQYFIEALPGKIGKMDVQDTHAATVHVLKTLGDKLDSDLVSVIGGSHGGFLSAHMIGQYPEVYKATVMRNPVINITTMSATTDIPDWCYVEALGSDMKYYDLDNSNVDVMNQMYLSSPIRYVDQMKAATLILLGREDRRVPMAQGRELYYALKKRNVTVKCCVYAFNDHPIIKPEAECDSTVLTLLWMRKHLLSLKKVL